jgi:beta-N-acetylhexosaminidase
LALGATWNPADVQEIGRVVGGELSAIGINFLLGPSLDVLTQPDPDGGDAGVRTFGGDPYWVSAIAEAYVRGLREGSNGRIAAALKHFPGVGDLRRDSDTLDKSLDQLQRVDLWPYFRLMTVPGGATRPLADAVLTSHARFRGFRDLRERTDPFSVDASAISTLLALPAVAAWRNAPASGLVVSDSLGDDNLRRFYDPNNSGIFPAQQIAFDAFLAGNDLLILNDFSLTGSALAERQTIRAVIEAFQQRYREDLEFQDRVDSAVKRILRLKYRLYPGFQPTAVVPIVEGLDARLRQGVPAVERVAQSALTRVHPGEAQVQAAPLPVPSPDDTFLVFTDDRLIVDCSQCPERTTLFTTAISQTLTRVGGVPPEQIASFGFADLKAYLSVAPAAPDLTDAFAQADWIILAQQNLQSDVQQADAVRLLLRERGDLIAGKPVTLFAFGPPHELSPEDLSAITAGYYALYSIGQPFVDAAVAAVFDLLPAASAPPVSVEAIGYDLTTQTEPDPDQVLALVVGEAAPGPGTPTPPPPQIRVGDTVRFRTGLIVDRNANPVPDGTPVRFMLAYHDASNVSRRVDTTTANGVAEIIVEIEHNGRLEVSVVSEPALNSVHLQMTIDEQGVTVIETLAPPPTRTPTLQPTITPTPSRTPTPSPTPIAWIDRMLGAEPRRANLIDFGVSLVVLAVAGGVLYWSESRRRIDGAIDRAVRLVLWGLLCGLVAYAGYAVGMPGADAVHGALGGWASPVVTLVGVVAPWIVDRVRQRSENG